MNDIAVIVKDLMALSIQKKVTISTAESCTGGLISKCITDQPGSSNFFNSSIISYSNESKVSLLHVKSRTIEEKGAVSEETVKEMAQGLLQITGSSVVIAVSGLMGADIGQGSQENTRVWFCWHNLDKFKTLYKSLHGDRRENRLETTKTGLLGLYDFIKEI